MTKSLSRIELGAHGADDLLDDAALDLLPLAVSGIEILRDGRGLVQIAREQ